MAGNSVSQEVAMKVERCARHAIEEQEQNAPEVAVELLKVISEPLMMELHFEIHAPILRSHPFFKSYMSVNPMGMRRVCHTAITILHVSRDDVIFTAWEAPPKPRMLFIVKGTLEYIATDGSYKTILNSTWVSEACLWVKDWVHAGTLRARSAC